MNITIDLDEKIFQNAKDYAESRDVPLNVWIATLIQENLKKTKQKPEIF